MFRWLASFLIKRIAKNLDKNNDGKVSATEISKSVETILWSTYCKVAEKLNNKEIKD